MGMLQDIEDIIIGVSNYSTVIDSSGKHHDWLISSSGFKQLANDLAVYMADLNKVKERNAQLEAARIAYANEFPLNEDGEPDVGNIHANIRKLKKELNTSRNPGWCEGCTPDDCSGCGGGMPDGMRVMNVIWNDSIPVGEFKIQKKDWTNNGY